MINNGFCIVPEGQCDFGLLGCPGFSRLATEKFGLLNDEWRRQLEP